MRYPAYLEVGPTGWTNAFVFALPAAVAAERARLVAAGRTLPAGAGEDAAIEITEAERIAVATDVAAGGTSALFRYELRPTRDEDIALVLDRLALAQEEIARALGAAFADAGATGAAGPALLSLADGEWWLHSRLGNRQAAHLPPESEPWARCQAVRAETIARLTHLLPGDLERHAVFGGEQWTTCKVLRRLACLARDAAATVGSLNAAAPPQAPTSGTR